ncbi:hypothetical protein ACFV9C_09325 [Kribbella sp. NPDC059898]|uniref:hypothetical protein n=1 Tax=Kribbella sp. NPDC059898 TaxID=3346995 RepID=UPI0036674F53
MADAQVSALIRKINELVEADTGSRSIAVGDQITRRVIRSDQRRLRALAANLDLPVRLTPRAGEADQRAEIRAAVTETIASCAGVLQPREPVQEPLYSYGQARYETANSRLYARYEVPGFVAGLRPGGRPDDLGIFPPPALEGDLLAAHAAAVAISARTGRPARAVVAELVAAGRGAHATAAARMLLQSRPGFAALPAPERNALTLGIADHLEAQFENHERQRPGPEIAAVLADRQRTAEFGSAAITTASRDATEEIAHLQRFFDEVGRPATVPRPESVHDLCRQVQTAVGELTDAPNSRWDGRLEPELGQTPDTTLRLTREQAVALGELLESSHLHPLGKADAAVARAGLQAAASSYARWAVPEDYDARHELAAAQVAPRYATLEEAVGTAFAEDELSAVADRVLPYELATQVRQAQPPAPDQRLAPAARAFAAVIDDQAGLEKGETLRQMAGENPVRMADAAAGQLMAAAGVPQAERPFAIRRVADEANLQFADLPTVLEHGTAASDYGTTIGKVAVSMAGTYAENPGMAQAEVVAAQQDPMSRFASADPALSHPHGRQSDPATTTNRPTTTPDQKRPALDR